MKNGRTHLAHKAEHAIDLDTGAIVAVSVHGADQGDTTTIEETLPEAAEQLEAVAAVTDAERAAVYANRRRIRGARGKRLLRKHGELLERPCAHLYETGGLRRAHVRGHENVLKRLLVHAGALNLGLWMRTLFGIGTPRDPQGCSATVATLLNVLWTLIDDARPAIGPDRRDPLRPDPRFLGSIVVGSFA